MSKIIDLNKYKNQQITKKELTRNRQPLYISYLDGEIKGSPHFQRHDDDDFADRIVRIKTSLEKINQLMKDLKKDIKP